MGSIIYGISSDSDAAVVVRQASTDSVSGTNLRTAYAKACALTPGGSALSATNRATVVLPPGRYDLGSTPLTLDTDYVDLIALCPAIGGAIAEHDWLWSDNTPTVAKTSANANLTKRPPPTLVYGTATGAATTRDTGVIIQSANDVRMSGFGIANEDAAIDKVPNLLHLTGAGLGNASALFISAADNSPSCYDMMWFWMNGAGAINQSAKGFIRTSCVASVTLGGTWTRCIANGFGFRALAGAAVTGMFIDCIGGPFSFIGDEIMASNSGRWERCRTVGHYMNLLFYSYLPGISAIDVTNYSGEASFGGCYTESGGLHAEATFIDCVAGDNSFGFASCQWSTIGVIPVGCNATFIRCRAGNRSFGGSGEEEVGKIGNFTGYAEDCVAGHSSFGYGATGETCTATNGNDTLTEMTPTGRFTALMVGDVLVAEGTYYTVAAYVTSSSLQLDRVYEGAGGTNIPFRLYSPGMTGELVRCKSIGGQRALMLGATAVLRDCRLQVTATGKNCIGLLASGAKLIGCDLEVLQGGVGIPIVGIAPAALDVFTAHCRMNNASVDADGLSNATEQSGTPGNVVYNGG